MRIISKIVAVFIATVPLGRVYGIRLKITATLLTMLGLTGALQSLRTTFLVISIFASILLHEFGHVWTARRYGLEVHGIKLDVIGGTAYVDIPKGTAIEWKISIAGPIVSVVLAILLFGIYNFLPYELIGTMFGANAVIAAFNLLPVFPMDGGRVLRAVLAIRLRDLVRATKLSVTVANVLTVPISLIAVIKGAYMVPLIMASVWLLGSSEVRSVERERASEEAER